MKPAWVARYYPGWLLCVLCTSPLYFVAFLLGVLVQTIVDACYEGWRAVPEGFAANWRAEYLPELIAWRWQFSRAAWKRARSLGAKPQPI